MGTVVPAGAWQLVLICQIIFALIFVKQIPVMLNASLASGSKNIPDK